MELIVLSGRAIFVKDIEAGSNECQLRCHPKPSDSPYSIKLFLLRESRHILVIVTFYNWKIHVSDFMTPLVTSSIVMVLDILYLCFHLLSLMFLFTSTTFTLTMPALSLFHIIGVCLW